MPIIFVFILATLGMPPETGAAGGGVLASGVGPAAGGATGAASAAGGVTDGVGVDGSCGASGFIIISFC